jgi:hypothetical protein
VKCATPTTAVRPVRSPPLSLVFCKLLGRPAAHTKGNPFGSLAFATIFGNRVFWFVGAILISVGYALGRADAPPGMSAFAGAAVESAFAVVLFRLARRESAS